MRNPKDRNEWWLKRRAETEIWLYYRWLGFSCISISTQESIFVLHWLLYLLNISQSMSRLPLYLFLPSIYLSSHFQVSPFLYLEFIFISCFLPLYCHSIFFFTAAGQCIFNLVSKTLLIARSRKEKFDISFQPIVLCSLQSADLWLVDSQLIKPPVVWHPGLVSKSDLAEWNKLTWPTAAWWMKWVHQWGENPITDWAVGLHIWHVNYIKFLFREIKQPEICRAEVIEFVKTFLRLQVSQVKCTEERLFLPRTEN